MIKTHFDTIKSTGALIPKHAVSEIGTTKLLLEFSHHIPVYSYRLCSGNKHDKMTEENMNILRSPVTEAREELDIFFKSEDMEKVHEELKLSPMLYFMTNPETNIPWAVFHIIDHTKKPMTQADFLADNPVHQLAELRKNPKINALPPTLEYLSRSTHNVYAGRQPFVSGVDLKSAVHNLTTVYKNHKVIEELYIKNQNEKK